MYAIERTVKDKITFLIQILFKKQSIKQALYWLALCVDLMQTRLIRGRRKMPP